MAFITTKIHMLGSFPFTASQVEGSLLIPSSSRRKPRVAGRMDTTMEGNSRQIAPRRASRIPTTSSPGRKTSSRRALT